MSLSQDAEFVITSGQDKRIRIWERTKEILVIEAEREMELEKEWDADLEKDAMRVDDTEGETVAQTTLESIRTGETLVEAIELAEEEAEKWREYQKSKFDKNVY